MQQTVVQQSSLEITGNFPVIVDYRRSLGTMIKAGKYARVNEQINYKNFPHNQNRSKTEQVIEFADFKREAGYWEATREILLCGYRHATLEELLAVGERWPLLQHDFSMLALGSYWVKDDGEHTFPWLTISSGERCLYLCPTPTTIRRLLIAVVQL